MYVGGVSVEWSTYFTVNSGTEGLATSAKADCTKGKLENAIATKNKIKKALKDFILMVFLIRK